MIQDNNKAKLIRLIEQKIQIIITVLMFFPVLFDVVQRSTGFPVDVLQYIVLKWGIGIGFYMILYLLFEDAKEGISIIELDAVNSTFWAVLFLLSLFMLMFSLYQNFSPNFLFVTVMYSIFMLTIFVAPLSIVGIHFLNKKYKWI